MREALARSDHDFVLSAPVRSRRAPKRKDGALMRIGAVLLHKPGRTLAIVVFAGMLSGVAMNALFFQTARHPAPIFHGPVIARPAQHATAPMPLSAPASAPVPVPPQRIVEKPAVQQQTAQPAPAAARVAEAPPKDQIGALLSGNAPTAAAPADSARVMAAQKALVKLGYVVKADGVMGGGTRKAIEMFEASRKLPVTGELTPRVTRELSALSGVAVP